MANIVNGTSTGSGGLITTGDSSDELQLQTAEVARVTLTNTAVVVNESGADVDFRVESDTVENALFVDGATGNVGIGEAPSAWGSGYTVIEMTGGNHVMSAQGLMQIGENSYFNGSAYIYKADGPAGRYNITNNAGNIQHAWSTAPTGSAGGTITFTERMRVTSDGYLRMASGSGGIQFGGDTAAANALDDYEEGTWTPTDASGAGLTLSVGGTPRYVKIGRLVFFTVELIIYPSTADGTTASVGGLPFTVDSNNHGTLSFVADTANASAGLSVANTTKIFFYPNGTTVVSTNANLSTKQIYGISGCYQVP